MRYAHSFLALPSACPRCETELDQTSGLCPACRVDPSQFAPAAEASVTDESSFSERYRGTPYQGAMAPEEPAAEGPMRTRVLLIVGIVGITTLFYLVAQSMYLI